MSARDRLIELLQLRLDYLKLANVACDEVLPECDGSLLLENDLLVVELLKEHQHLDIEIKDPHHYNND